jgi:hypothetical protein
MTRLDDKSAGCVFAILDIWWVRLREWHAFRPTEAYGQCTVGKVRDESRAYTK